jgi:CofD-related protein of GAK system
MSVIRVCRTAKLPDPVRISRYQRVPELGPKILFFSGGSALNDVSRCLKHYTHNSVHLVTPFDSGGSSAKLREAFNMPAIGDLRSRLVALADDSVTGHPEVYELFAHRLSENAAPKALAKELDELLQGRHSLVQNIPNPMRRIVRNQLDFFYENMTADFDLSGASIGNLILAGGYLNNYRHLDPIIFLFSKLVAVHGTVRAIVNGNHHLVADLEDGQRVLGQHNLTGKEVCSIESKVESIFLTNDLSSCKPVSSEVRKKNRQLIIDSELICFPPGSFYSSLIANLLPSGVGQAVAKNDAPKVFIPNLGCDPEQYGLSINETVEKLLFYLRKDAGENVPTERLLNFVMVDSAKGEYNGELDKTLLLKQGIQVIDTPLISDNNTRYDPERLVYALLSLV